MNILTFVATVLLSVAPSPCIKAPSVEKQVDKILAGMTQEQKIGQMIQLEVTQLAYNKYEFRSLIALGPEELGKIVQEKGLSSQYNVKEMFAGIKEGDQLKKGDEVYTVVYVDEVYMRGRYHHSEVFAK